MTKAGQPVHIQSIISKIPILCDYLTFQNFPGSPIAEIVQCYTTKSSRFPS